jgi:hypothetical protein
LLAATSGQRCLCLRVDGCDLNVIDSDDTSGKYLIGFPASINPKLYPHQRVGLTSLAGAWIVKDRPQRYKITPQTSKFYVDTGGDDTNDGISLPLKTFAAVKVVLQRELDFNGMTPVILPTLNQTWTNDPLSLDGGFVGGYLRAAHAERQRQIHYGWNGLLHRGSRRGLARHPA